MSTLYDAAVSADVNTAVITPALSATGERIIAGTAKWNHGSGSEDLVAVLRLQCCDDDDPANIASTDIGFLNEPTASFPSNPAGAAGSTPFNFQGCYNHRYRILSDYTSGDGRLEIKLNNPGT